MDKTLILTSNILKCFGETSTCVYKKTDHPESILFGSLNLNTITMTLLEFEVHMMIISLLNFIKIGYHLRIEILHQKCVPLLMVLSLESC